MKYQQYALIPITIAICGLLYFPNAYSDTSARRYHCNYYASDAVEQHKQNLQFNCGYKSLRWNSDKAGQRKWCMSVRETISNKENEVRKKMLDQCFKAKISLTNTNNHPEIPNSCKDSKGNYTPIKSIYSWYRYQKEIRTPVQNGLISADFNRDGRLDYIFIEQNKKQNVQLTTCFSHKGSNSYKRKLTSISFSAEGDSLMSDSYNISMLGKRVHLSLSYFEHNAGSSSSDGYYRYNPDQHVFELKDSTVRSAGIPIGADYTEPYPIHTPRPPETL